MSKRKTFISYLQQKSLWLAYAMRVRLVYLARRTLDINLLPDILIYIFRQSLAPLVNITYTCTCISWVLLTAKELVTRICNARKTRVFCETHTWHQFTTWRVPFAHLTVHCATEGQTKKWSNKIEEMIRKHWAVHRALKMPYNSRGCQFKTNCIEEYLHIIKSISF